MEVLVLIIALSQLLMYGKKIQDEKKQKAVHEFAFLNLIVFCASIIFFIFSSQSSTLASVYLLMYFSGNIPPVLYWQSYLKKHFIAPTLQKTGVRTISHFFQKYNISKLEEEIIRQLCEGKANKEISEVLFISLQTVKDHIYRIYQKTDVKSRVQLINLIQSDSEEE